METTAVPDYPWSARFEKVWAILQRNAESQERLRESQEETDRQIEKLKESQEKTGLQLQEVKILFDKLGEKQDKVTEQMKLTDKQMGRLHNSFGQLAEHMVAPGIHARFNELGYFFGEVTPGGHKIYGEDGKLKAEIDILLENGDTIMAVEVKSKVVKGDMEDFIERLEILSHYRRKKNDRRKIQGAIAGAIFGSAQKREVIKAGLYVIEQTGDTMKIDIPDSFIPREW